MNCMGDQYFAVVCTQFLPAVVLYMVQMLLGVIDMLELMPTNMVS